MDNVVNFSDHINSIVRERAEALGDDMPPVELGPICFGEEIVGVLEESDRELFSLIANLSVQIEDASREIHARAYEVFARATRNAKGVTSMKEFDKYVQNESKKIFSNEDEAKTFFETQSTYDLLRHYFSHKMKDAFGHGSVYGVRAEWKIVRVSRMYIVPDASGDIVNFNK